MDLYLILESSQHRNVSSKVDKSHSSWGQITQPNALGTFCLPGFIVNANRSALQIRIVGPSCRPCGRVCGIKLDKYFWILQFGVDGNHCEWSSPDFADSRGGDLYEWVGPEMNILETELVAVNVTRVEQDSGNPVLRDHPSNAVDIASHA